MTIFEEYEEKFEENFPVYECDVPKGKTMEDVAKECIKRNRPYKVKEEGKNLIY